MLGKYNNHGLTTFQLERCHRSCSKPISKEFLKKGNSAINLAAVRKRRCLGVVPMHHNCFKIIIKTLLNLKTAGNQII